MVFVVEVGGEDFDFDVWCGVVCGVDVVGEVFGVVVV